MRTILGAPGDSVIRGGYNVAYQRGGMSDFTEVYGDNPGILIDATRSTTNGNLGTAAGAVRRRQRQPRRAGHPAHARLPDGACRRPARTSAPSTRTSRCRTRAPAPSASSARCRRNMSVEARYIHTDSYGSWTLRNLSGALNYNEINIVENKFIDEFRLAQANLVANIAAGKGNTFAYTGVARHEPAADLPREPERVERRRPTRRSTPGPGGPTPRSCSRCTRSNPNPQTAASNLRTNADVSHQHGRGGPARPTSSWSNPEVTNSTVVTNGPSTKYNGDPADLQPPVHRRLPGAGQLHVRQGLPERLLLVPQAVRRAGADLLERVGEPRQRPAQHGGELGVRPAVRPRQEVGQRRRRRHEPPDRRLEHHGARPLAERPHGGLRQRAAGRHDEGRCREDAQAPEVDRPEQPVPHAGVDAAAGRHRQHDQGVQRVGHRLHGGDADGPLLRAGQQPDVPGNRGRVRRLRRRRASS